MQLSIILHKISTASKKRKGNIIIVVLKTNNYLYSTMHVVWTCAEKVTNNTHEESKWHGF